jgi:signal transduction histidine kinase
MPSLDAPATVEALLIAAHEAERARLAQELHDDLGQRLAAVTMDLDLLVNALPLSEAELRARIGAISNVALGLARDVQALSQRLYPPRLERVGLVGAVVSLGSALSKQLDIEVAVSHADVPHGVPTPVVLALVRVMQEAVGNAAAHARVRRVDVVLRGEPDHVQLDVVDTGTGFDPDAVRRGRAAGLVGMRERVRLLGGELSILSTTGQGTRIRARIPLESPSVPAAR